MKNYLSLAAVLGAVALLGVSQLARAQQPAASTPVATTDATASATASAVVPDATITYAKDRAACDALASAPTTEGATPSQADKMASIKKCLADKGHTAEEIKKEEGLRSQPPAAPAPDAK